MKVDRDGTQSVIFNLWTENSGPSGGGLVYSQQDGYYLYCPQDVRSGLYAIRPEPGEAVKLTDTGTNPQYTFFVTDETMVDDMTAPRMARAGEMAFMPGASEASVSWHIPRCAATARNCPEPRSHTARWSTAERCRKALSNRELLW